MAEPDEPKIGKYEQFEKIKRYDWKLIVFVIIKTLLLSAYFVFALVYQELIITTVRQSSSLIGMSYNR